MSDRRAEERVRQLLADGDPGSLAEAMRVLRHHAEEYENERRVYGVAADDLASVQHWKTKRKHLVLGHKSRRQEALAPGVELLRVPRYATQCGLWIDGAVTWRRPNAVRARANGLTLFNEPDEDPATWCRTCSFALAYGSAHAFHAAQCKALKVPSHACKTGKHQGDPCETCEAVSLPLFGVAT